MQFFRRLLTLSVQNSVAQIIPLWVRLCVRVRTVVTLCIQRGVPLFVGVCVFKKVCEAGRLCGSSVGMCMTGRVSAAAQPQSSLNPLSCVVHSCHISPIVSTDKEAQLKLNAS